MNIPNLDKYKKNYEEQSKKYQQIEKEREKIIMNRQQLEAQLTENNLVKTELDLLKDDTNVFKLIGPALVKQDLEESKSTVNKRLEYINQEISRCETSLDDVTKRLTTSRQAVDNSAKEFQMLVAKGS